jgi:hypothetical protein
MLQRRDYSSASPHQEVDMGDQQQLHELRQKAHNMGIEGSSKMTEDQLNNALKRVAKGEQPQMAKQEAKQMAKQSKR